LFSFATSITQFEIMAYTTVAVGNPGAGKSTFMNALAGASLFESGIKLGSGLTSVLDVKTHNGQVFIDTPGLADAQMRKKAAEAIRDGLKRGGNFKVLFFIGENSGRAVVQDTTTMKLVLDAAPEIGQNYGVIVNKVEEEVMEALEDDNQRMTFYLAMFSGVPEKQRCVFDMVLFFPKKTELRGKKNVVLSAEDLKAHNGGSLKLYVERLIQSVNITSGNVQDIQIDQFDKMKEKLEDMERQLREQDERHRRELADAARRRSKNILSKILSVIPVVGPAVAAVDALSNAFLEPLSKTDSKFAKF